ncbi:MAG: hypothetical protein EOO45_02220 [Flavobacterium sp.]|nr:MAG: hypothetical protein EOO45_02220 [Flavobacterium sp.]
MKFNPNYHYDTELLQNLTIEYMQKFEEDLKNHPDYKKLKSKFLFDYQNHTIVQIHYRTPITEIKDLSQEQRFFYPLCSKEEIGRIFNVQNADDYLLRYRAEQVVDSSRLHRNFIALRKSKKSRWSFTSYYPIKPFSIYLKTLPEPELNTCKALTCGYINLHEANGYCMKTDYGNIVVISYALRYFLYYMNVFHYGDQLDIAEEDTFNAFLIAVRTMLGNESLDFDLDSRGDLPKAIHRTISRLTDNQMQFIIGHEFAHHYLGHLDGETTNLVKTAFSDNTQAKFYGYSQRHELEADLAAVMRPNISDAKRCELADAAISFFLWLDLYSCVSEYISPSNGGYRSHPDPIDRINELRKALPIHIGISEEQIEGLIKYYSGLKEHLQKEILPFEIESFECYGSVYLPTYKGEIKIDRFQF